ncbi:unnamed protein product, partial [Mesorhabditis belari]|uniref:ShKT domain-containing protein n=1 Tax=Mesorhabditis belari TaxID=2138241 RepID=A0AAF3EW20_9BILA
MNSLAKFLLFAAIIGLSHCALFCTSSVGPCLSGACPGSNSVCVGPTSNPVCCNASNIYASSSSTTSTTTSTCYDLLNPVTGVSDCPRRAFLCADSTYYNVMIVQCPLTCGFCGGSTSYYYNSTCTDSTNAYSGISDCASLRYLCYNSVYSTLMQSQCCQTCLTYGKKK